MLQRPRRGLQHAASLRPSAGRGERHGAAQSDGVPRLDQRADPDAGQGTSRREAGRDEPRGAGAAVLLDRLERAPRRQLESPAIPELRPAATPLRTGQGVGQQRRRSGRRVPGGGRGVSEPGADPVRRSAAGTACPTGRPDRRRVSLHGRRSASPAAGQSCGSPASDRLGRWRRHDSGLDSRRRVRDGQPGRRSGRAAALRDAR